VGLSVFVRWRNSNIGGANMKDFDWFNTGVIGIILYATGGIGTVVIFALYVLLIYDDMLKLYTKLTAKEDL
jgi:hypothetical protein